MGVCRMRLGRDLQAHPDTILYTNLMSNKQQLLDQIKQDILEQNICPNLAETANQLVMGSGSVDAEIVFIGEAPGKKEDELGVPFVGAAGKFLDKMLESVGLTRDEVYITNIVKYRPPDNRDPTRAEKQAFWPSLARQIETIQPKVVVTLGRHSMEFFLPDAKIGEVHGLPSTLHLGSPGLGGVDSIVMLPLYHPAAALYNGSLRQTLLDDFRIVSKLTGND